jgi:hypothetical protein
LKLFNVLSTFLDSDDPAILLCTSQQFCLLTADSRYKDSLTNQTFFERMCHLLTFNHLELKVSVFTFVTNVLAWGKEFIQYFLDNSILDALKPLLVTTEDIDLKRIALRMIATMLKNYEALLQIILEYEKGIIITRLFDLMRFDTEDIPEICFDLLGEICKISTYKEMKFLIDRGYLEALVHILKNPASQEIRDICLKSLENFVEQTNITFGKEKHPMAIQCFNRVQVIAKSVFGNKDFFLNQAIFSLQKDNSSNRFDQERI